MLQTAIMIINVHSTYQQLLSPSLQARIPTVAAVGLVKQWNLPLTYRCYCQNAGTLTLHVY